MSVFVRALDKVNDTTVIAKPKLLVLNRQRATLHVGASLGYLSSESTDTSTTQTVEYLEVGTQLTVRPFAGDDGFVRLEIKPSVSDGSTVQVGSNVIPNRTSNELTTNVMVRSGQTVVLGGLFKEDTTITTNRVPGVGQLPIVGAAFSGHDDEITRSEVIFLITPTVLKDQAAYAGGAAAKEDVNSLGMGAKAGLLPWSRGRQSAQHLRNALKNHKLGYTDKALFYTKMALSLEPTNPDALRLKRQLVEGGDSEPSGSILQNAVDTVVAEQRESEAQIDDAASETVAPTAAVQPDEAAAQPKTAEQVTPVAETAAAAQPDQAAAQPKTAKRVTIVVKTAAAPQPDPESITDPLAAADSPSARVLEAMSRWLPDAPTTATTADAGGDEANH